MKPSMVRSLKSKPAPGVQPGTQQAPCSIIFGHNTSVRQVCLLLNVAATQLIFSPEEAEDVAAKLQYYAKAARGEKPA
jgi:hypothetical protein